MRFTKTFILSLGSITCIHLSAEESDSSQGALQEYHVVTSIQTDDNILPTKLPVKSVYGTEINVIDTPRNVTVISKAQLDAISIKDTRDYVKLTASSYTSSNFGAPTTPSIRGQIADTLINGMRKGLTSNGNGLPTNFNSVESVNILKGPPSVMIGASQYVGGYTDLITKKPRFADNNGYFRLTLDSEGLQKAELDQNWSVSDSFAMRFSLTGEDSTDYYWDDYKRQTSAFYAAAVWIPNSNYTLEVNGEYFKANYTENFGINRPTDDLLSNGTYVTGIGTANGFGDSLTTTGTTKISRTKRLHGEGDDSNGEYLYLQAIQTIEASADLTIVNNSFFQYLDRDTYSSYEYSEVMRDNYRFENRTEFQTSANLLDWFHNINTGLSFSYQNVWSVNDFYHEPANAWDLANQSPSEISVTDASVFSTGGFYNAFPIYGESPRGQLSYRPGSTTADYYVSATDEFILGGGDGNDSQTTSVGIFLQDEIEINDRLTLLLGGRLDYVYVQSKDPMFSNMLRYLQTTNPGNDYSELTQAKDSYGDIVPNFNLGVVYALTDNTNLYANYNYSESIPIGQGGGVPLNNETGKLNEDGFNTESQLVEVGFKSSLFDDTLFYTANLFYQTRTDPQSKGERWKVVASGFETELAYQPSKELYIIAGYSYIDSVTKNGRVVTDTPISSVPSNGGVYNYSSIFEFSGYDADTPGVPESTFSGLALYQITDKLSTSLGLVVTSPIPLGFNVPASATNPLIKTVEIPWQYSIDLGFTYETERWAIALNILNLTDEENWGSPNPIYGNDSVYAELPRRLELAVTLKW